MESKEKIKIFAHISDLKKKKKDFSENVVNLDMEMFKLNFQSWTSNCDDIKN